MEPLAGCALLAKSASAQPSSVWQEQSHWPNPFDAPAAPPLAALPYLPAGLSFPEQLVEELKGTAAHLELQRAQVQLGCPGSVVSRQRWLCGAPPSAASTAAAGSLRLMRPCPSFAGAPAATVRQNPSTSCATLHACSHVDLSLKSPRRRTCGGSTVTHSRCSTCCCKPTPSSCSPTGLTTTATCGLQVRSCFTTKHHLRVPMKQAVGLARVV